MSAIRDLLALAYSGTSLTTGRLSADWVNRITAEAKTYDECVGPVQIWNMGRGGWTSTDILNNIPNIVALKPAYVITESGSINDCAETGGVPAVSLAQHDTNLEAIITQLRAGIPGVKIFVQTMSPVSVTNTIRPQLATYYAHDITVAQGLDVDTVDNFADWINPLPVELTYDGDGLHPIWAGAVQDYLFPNMRTLLRSIMTEFWA